MQALAEKRIWTDGELRALPRDGRKYEVLNGELIVSPTGFQHGYICSRLLAALLDHALKRRLGVVVDSSTGFRMADGDCLSPDVSFVRKERLRNQKRSITRFFNGAPDLIIEVTSPGESRRRIRQKLARFFANGTCLAWIVDPSARTVSVYRSPSRFVTLRTSELLQGEDVLPGFEFPVDELFEIPDFGG
jgi:Uma2 family endonuclease